MRKFDFVHALTIDSFLLPMVYSMADLALKKPQTMRTITVEATLCILLGMAG
jgi:hypothetical protein